MLVEREGGYSERILVGCGSSFWGSLDVVLCRRGVQLYALVCSRGVVVCLAMLRLLRYRGRGRLCEASKEGEPCRGRALVDQE